MSRDECDREISGDRIFILFIHGCLTLVSLGVVLLALSPELLSVTYSHFTGGHGSFCLAETKELSSASPHPKPVPNEKVQLGLGQSLRSHGI